MEYQITAAKFQDTTMNVLKNGSYSIQTNDIAQLVGLTGEKEKRNLRDWMRKSSATVLKNGRSNYYSMEDIATVLVRSRDRIDDDAIDARINWFSETGIEELRTLFNQLQTWQPVYDVKVIEVVSKEPTESPEVLELKKEVEEKDSTIRFLQNEIAAAEEKRQELSKLFIDSNQTNSELYASVAKLEDELESAQSTIQSENDESRFEKFLRKRLMSDNSYMVATVFIILALLPFSVSAFMKYAAFEGLFRYGSYLMALVLCGAWDWSILIFALKGTKVDFYDWKLSVADIGTFFQIVFISTHFDFIQMLTDSDFVQKIVVVSCIIFYTSFILNQLSKLSKR